MTSDLPHTPRNLELPLLPPSQLCKCHLPQGSFLDTMPVPCRGKTCHLFGGGGGGWSISPRFLVSSKEVAGESKTVCFLCKLQS